MKRDNMAEYMIEARGLEKDYGTVQALKGVSFQINRGEFFGCFGPNGAGKTSLLKIMTGQIEATQGDARVVGVDVRKDPIEIRRRIINWIDTQHEEC